MNTIRAAVSGSKPIYHAILQSIFNVGVCGCEQGDVPKTSTHTYAICCPPAPPTNQPTTSR